MTIRFPTSALLDGLLHDADAERVTLGWLVDRLGDRSFGLVMLLLALLGAMPGASAIVAPLLAILAVQMMLGHAGPGLPPARRRAQRADPGPGAHSRPCRAGAARRRGLHPSALADAVRDDEARGRPGGAAARHAAAGPRSP
nr:exopolysaccharide biosynthesis protein [Mycobacterium sp. KBS0706]